MSAGSVDVAVACETKAISPVTPAIAASFNFDALSGHHYLITSRNCHGCVELTDETTQEVVAEFPAYSCSKEGGKYRCAQRLGSEKDLSTGDHTATILGGNCLLFDGKVHTVIVNAGLVDIDVTCAISRWMETPRVERVTSSFAIDVKAGHTYKFYRNPLQEECIGLFDTTVLYIFESKPITCEPYDKID